MEFTPVNVEARKKLGLRTGDTVRVMQKIEEKGKTRLQPFEGLVIAIKHGTEAGATFIVRRVAGGYGVEKIFPLYSPIIDSIEITKRSKVRRSKLYHIRETALKQIRKRMKMMFVDIKEDKTEGVEEEVKEKSEEESQSAESAEAEGEPTNSTEEEKTESGTEEKPETDEKTKEEKTEENK